jgi:hypothetical protein
MGSSTLADTSGGAAVEDATLESEQDVAADNYEQQTIDGQTVRYRPAPIAGDPAVMGRVIRAKLRERELASHAAH